MQFLKLLKNTSKPTSKQRREELWDIEGILHNQKFKFDTRPLKNNIKGGSFKTKADKVVYDINDQYIIVDVGELHKFLKDKKLKKVVLEELISELDWNIILPKN